VSEIKILLGRLRGTPMTVQDDLRRLSQMDSIFLGYSGANFSPVTSWYKGRVQQAGDGTWIFRSISQDGSVVGYQLGFPGNNWSSDEQPSTGIRVFIQVTQTIVVPIQPPIPPIQLNIATVLLQQQLPNEMTN
jgi:hypothetical protein